MTVFRRGALVTREAELGSAAELPERVQITGLPLTLDDSSLRIEVHGQGSLPSAGEGSLPIASDVRVTIAVPDEDPSLRAAHDLDHALEQAELVSAQVARELADLQQALANLAALEPGERGEPKPGHAPQPSPIAARLVLLEFRRARADALIARVAELQDRRRLANEEVASLRERKRLASQARNTRSFEVRKAAVIRLESRGPASGPLRLRLTYFVTGARWAPAYTVRLDRDRLDRVEATLELRAMVGQQSGEDWTNVALVLSTASPQQWTELPDLRAQKIGRAQPEPAKTGWRSPPVGAQELYADYDRDLAGRRPVSAAPQLAPPVMQGARSLSSSMASASDENVEEARILNDMIDTRSLTRSGQISGPPPPSFAAPPPGAAVPMAMPMARPAPAQSMSAPKRSAGLGAMLGGALEAAFGGGGAGIDPADTGSMLLDLDELALDGHEPGSLVAGRELLDYGRLRMLPAIDPQRGALRRIDLRLLYQQLTTTTLQFEVAFTRLDVALGLARSFEAAAAPARYRFPEREAGFDYAYVADGAIDLASDGKFHSLPIRADAAEAKLRYVTVPRETQDVFRIVALRNPLNAPLLAGPADVYVDGRFALTSDVASTPIGGRLELGLGVEQAIKIARNVKYEEDSAGLIKRQHALIHTVEVEVGNNLACSATVEVRERLPTIPTGLEGDIQVAVREVRPAWVDYEQHHPPLEGGRMWQVEVPAGETRKLQATWVITIPHQHELIGGNRRES